MKDSAKDDHSIPIQIISNETVEVKDSTNVPRTEKKQKQKQKKPNPG